MTSKTYSTIGIFRLFLGTILLMSLVSCGNSNDSKASHPQKVNQDVTKAFRGDPNIKASDLQGIWVVDSLSTGKDQKVYDLEKGVLVGTAKEIFVVDADKNSKIMMTFVMGKTDLTIRVYVNGVEKSKVEAEFEIKNKKMIVKYDADKDKKENEFKVKKISDQSLIIGDKDKRYSLKSISEKQLQKIIDQHSKGETIKLSELAETPDQS